MKRFLAIIITLAASLCLFAEEKTISFAEQNVSEVYIKTNTSQKTKEKAVSGGITFYAERKFASANSSVYIEFIEEPKLENVGDIKAIKVKGKSYGYPAAVRLHLVGSKGQTKVLTICQTPARAGEYEEEWKNDNYIENVKDRNPVLKPVWPFNDSDWYITAIEFHMNAGLADYPYNVQTISEIAFIYDKANLDSDIVDELNSQFDLVARADEAAQKRKEAKKAEKKEAEELEQQKMATESFDKE